MMFDRNRGDSEKERTGAEEALRRSHAELEAERLRLEEERARLERLQQVLEDRQDELERHQDRLAGREEQLEEELGSAEEVSEVLDIVSARIPTIVKDVQTVLYSVESLKKMGEAIGAFYRELIEAGIPEREASRLTMLQQTRLNDITDGRRIHVRPVFPPHPPVRPRAVAHDRRGIGPARHGRDEPSGAAREPIDEQP